MTDQFQIRAGIGEKEQPRYFLVFVDVKVGTGRAGGAGEGKRLIGIRGKPVFGNSNWKISLGKRSIPSERDSRFRN
jgi:hypothetical protein